MTLKPVPVQITRPSAWPAAADNASGANQVCATSTAMASQVIQCCVRLCRMPSPIFIPVWSTTDRRQEKSDKLPDRPSGDECLSSAWMQHRRWQCSRVRSKCQDLTPVINEDPALLKAQGQRQLVRGKIEQPIA